MLEVDEIAVDGSKFKRETGFYCAYPEMTSHLIREWQDALEVLGLFPKKSASLQ